MTDLVLCSSDIALPPQRKAERLRIGLVGPLPPPAGGMATQCRQLWELLRSEGLEVVLVQTNAPYRPSWIERVRGIRALFRLVPYLLALKRMCAQVDVIHLLANSGWAWHLFAAPAVWIAYWQRVPVIVNYRGGDAERFLSRCPRWVKATIRAAQARVVPSAFLQQTMGRFGIQTTIIPNIIDAGMFSPRQETRGGGSTQIIVTRNLEALYGIDYALRAFSLVVARHADVRMTIAGEGPERQSLLRLATELGVSEKVNFSGRLERSAIAELYGQADIMLNPSTIDNMPNSILEAYASGTAVVSTNVGGIPFIAREGETALLVPPRDPAAMAEAVFRLIDDEALAQRLAHNGLRESQRYRWSEIREQWLGLYQSLSAHGNVVAENQ